MDAEELRARQAPFEERYREHPDTALVTLRASGVVWRRGHHLQGADRPGLVEAGLHRPPAGDGLAACSGDMLLEALVACAGVTLRAVATALGIALRGGTVTAEGDLDFRGTLGVSKEVPVGFTAIRLHFDLDTDAQRRPACHSAETHRALLRHLPDAAKTRRAERLAPGEANRIGLSGSQSSSRRPDAGPRGPSGASTLEVQEMKVVFSFALALAIGLLCVTGLRAEDKKEVTLKGEIVCTSVL